MATPAMMMYNNGSINQWEDESAAAQNAATTTTSSSTSNNSNIRTATYSNRRSTNNYGSDNREDSSIINVQPAARNGGDEKVVVEYGCGKFQRRHLCHRRMPSSTMTMARRCALVLMILCTQLSNNALVAGLTCYETVNGKTTIVQNESWTYCALVPSTIVGNELVNGSQFGLGPDNDMMAAYNTAFAMSVDEYRILTVCIYERYDFSRFMTIKPDLAVEFAFRCVCNYDLCNSEPTFSAYLSAIKSESFARR
ncbi:hypothetical protein niasHT_006500 [Heterodera trifolii]|uniref:Uncharacterized protein n=1 Tax=Heterodera trifolii TaxID=157864 RepID=A0ABD2LTV1_9BILA